MCVMLDSSLSPPSLSLCLSLCIYVFMSFCLCVFLSLCLAVFVFFCLYVWLSWSFCLCVFLSFCLSVSLSLCSLYPSLSLYFAVYVKYRRATPPAADPRDRYDMDTSGIECRIREDFSPNFLDLPLGRDVVDVC